MPTFRCEFDVKGDLVLPGHVSELKLDCKKNYTTILRNGEVDKDGHPTKLVAIVIGPTESLDTAQDELREVIAEQLDLLSFATHSRFQITAPRRLIEWEANQKTVPFKTFHTADARYPPDPELTLEYLETVKQLEEATPPAFTRMALKYFRLGLIDDQPEDQFMRLWLALEIIAENVKDKESKPLTCPKCQAALKCPACGTEPTRVPMAKPAIEGLIAKITGERSQEISKRQFIARNSLMHGRSSSSIESECKMTLHDIVNELGGITWNAIMSTIFFNNHTRLTLGHRDGVFANHSVVMCVTGSFEHTGDDAYPTEDKIPTLDIRMRTSFET